MSIFFLMPLMSAPSELWMQRMIEMIKDHITMIGSYYVKRDSWIHGIPVANLRSSLFWGRMFERVKRPVGTFREAYDIHLVRRIMRDNLFTAVLVHYVDFALRFRNVWDIHDIPIYVHCHGYDVTWDLHDHERPDKRYFSNTYLSEVKELSKRVTLIANSDFTKRRLIDAGIDDRRIVRKYLGVHIPMSPLKHQKETKDIEILYLGRLIDFKGPCMVIKAFEKACAEGLSGRLTIAGDGPLRAACENLRLNSRYQHRIKILGAIDEVTGDLLRREADIFTAHNCLGEHTRQEEAFGVSIVEAMAAALPVITGDSGAVSETVINGKTGILVESGDIEAHAAALLELAHNPDTRRNMGIAGWQRASEVFSFEREKKELHSILGLRNGN